MIVNSVTARNGRMTLRELVEILVDERCKRVRWVRGHRSERNETARDERDGNKTRMHDAQSVACTVTSQFNSRHLTRQSRHAFPKIKRGNSPKKSAPSQRTGMPQQ